MELSAALEHYVETIFDLTDEHGHAHVKEIAARIGIKMASVTQAMQNLSELGLVHYKARQAVTLTDEGEAIGRELNRRHRVLVAFMHTVLGSPAERAERFACQIEHIVDREFILRLDEFVTFIKNSPGEPVEQFHNLWREQYLKTPSKPRPQS